MNGDKAISISSLVVGLVILGFVVFGGNKVVVQPNNLGGRNHNTTEDFSEGISVDGTVVIDGSGNWDGAVTGTTGTFSSTLGVTGNATVGGTLGVTGTTDLGLLKQGTSIRSTSTSNSAETLLAADLAYSSISYTPNVTSVTLTMPASSTLTSFIPTSGEMTQVAILNATGTAARVITLADGTGTDIQVASSSNATLGIWPGKLGVLLCRRDAASDIDCILQSGY